MLEVSCRNGRPRCGRRGRPGAARRSAVRGLVRVVLSDRWRAGKAALQSASAASQNVAATSTSVQAQRKRLDSMEIGGAVESLDDLYVACVLCLQVCVGKSSSYFLLSGEIKGHTKKQIPELAIFDLNIVFQFIPIT